MTSVISQVSAIPGVGLQAQGQIFFLGSWKFAEMKLF